MQKSKLTEHLKCLSEQEIHALRRFLLSPYFHEKALPEAVLTLFEDLIQYGNTYDSPELDKYRLYARIFPDSPMVKSRLEKTMTRLLQEIQRFIAWEMQHRQQTPEDDALQLLQFYKEKGLFEAFEHLTEKLRKQLQDNPVQDSAYFKRLYQLEAAYCAFLAWNNDRKSDLNLHAVIPPLAYAQILEQLEYAVLYLSHAKVTPLNSGILPLHPERWYDQLEQMAYPKPPLAEVYINAYELLRQKPDPALFLKFHESLEKHENKLPEDLVKNFQALARNYCIREFNNGNESFFSVAFHMYKQHLERGYLYRNDKLHAIVLKNLVSMGLRMGEYAWVIQFLEAHRERISGMVHPEEAYRFNLALCRFYIRDYAAVLEGLQHSYEDIFYKTAAKRLEIKALYELQSPILEFRLEAFNILIFRMGGKQLSDVYINGNKRFIALLRRILSPSTLHNARRIQKLRQNLQAEHTIVEKEWLFDVLDRLEQAAMI